jgi:hypothetical protein
MHRQLLQMSPGIADAVDATQPDRWVTGHEHDKCSRELFRCARAWQRPDAERFEQGVGGGLEVGQQPQLVGTDRADDG